MIYADNAATTKMSPKAIEAMVACFQEFGNPSSLYSIGLQAKQKLERARADIASVIHARPEEIVFTSGGSEADNHAIRSAAEFGRKNGKMHIVSTAFEHHAVLHTLKRLESEGFSVTLLNVHENGIVRPAELEASLRRDTCLVTIMHANNEIGTIQPIYEIAKICKKHKVTFHTDAVQTVGHLPIDVRDGIDLLSASAHKFHGPKGVGFLYVKKGVYISPLIEGGAQELGRRAGTENLPAVVGMAAALKESDTSDKLISLRDKLINGLSAIPNSILNGDPSSRLPGNVNFCFEKIAGEDLVLLLDSYGICASAGSACTSASVEPSHVMLAIGRPYDLAKGSVRFSLGEDATEDDIDQIIETVGFCVEYLRRFV